MGERLTEVINYLIYRGLIKNDADLGRYLATASSRISDMKSGRRKVNAQFVLALVKQFPIINRDYLLDEECTQMLVGDKSTVINGNGNDTISNSPSATINKPNDHMSELVEQLKAENEKLTEHIEWMKKLIDQMMAQNEAQK